MSDEPTQEAEFDAEYDCDTLIRAEQIKGDPKRHKAAQKAAREKVKALRTVSKSDEE